MTITGHRSIAAYMGYVHSERARAAEVADSVGARLAALAQQPVENVVALEPKRRRGAR